MRPIVHMHPQKFHFKSKKSNVLPTNITIATILFEFLFRVLTADHGQMGLKVRV